MEIIILGALAVVVNRFVEGFIKPLFEKFSLDKFWLMYIAWILAGILVFLTDANVFAQAMPKYPLIGQIMTAIFAGGGANILADWANAQKAK